MGHPNTEVGKGVYPIFAIMSHECVCNARYVVDPATFSMYVRARTNIKVGGTRSQCAIVHVQRGLRRGSGYLQHVRARQNQRQGRWKKVSMCMCNARYVMDPATFSMYVCAMNQRQGRWKKVSMCMCNARYVVDPATFSMYVRSRTSIKVRRGSRTQCLIGQ